MNKPLALKVMMYHYVRDPGDAAEAGSGISGMPTGVFQTQLEELGRHHTFVTWQDVQQAICDDCPLPESACLLTFDDGVIDHYLNVFPILQRRNLSGLFFALDRLESAELVLAHKIHFLLAACGVSGLRDAIRERLSASQREQFAQAERIYKSKFPGAAVEDRIDLLKAILQRDLSADVNPILSDLFERHVGSEREIAGRYYLNGEQIREMIAGGMHFGGHSRGHPWFDWIGAQARAAEIEASAAWLGKFEPQPWAFAYPYGGLADDSPHLLSRRGFVAAFTTKTQLMHDDPYFIGRLDGEAMELNGEAYD